MPSKKEAANNFDNLKQKLSGFLNAVTLYSLAINLESTDNELINGIINSARNLMISIEQHDGLIDQLANQLKQFANNNQNRDTKKTWGKLFINNDNEAWQNAAKAIIKNIVQSFEDLLNSTSSYSKDPSVNEQKLRDAVENTELLILIIDNSSTSDK